MTNSTSSKQIKRAVSLRSKAKARQEESMYVVEGLRIHRELDPEDVDALYVTENFAGNRDNRERMERFRPETVSDVAINVMADTRIHQGVLAAARQKRYTMDDIVRPASGVRSLAIMILETTQDPGNLGTIIRAGEGVGITGIIMNHATADLYNPEVMRSTMGPIYRMPFVYAVDLQDTYLFMKEKGVRLSAAHLKGMNNYDQEDYTDNVGFLTGNEANGLTEGAVSLVGCLMRISMEGKVESLSTAAVASVPMFETVRQRRSCRQ